MAKSSRYANCAGNPAAQYVVVGRNSAAACNPFFPEIQETAEKLQRIQFKNRLNIEVVDDTAVIGAPLLFKGKNHRLQKTEKDEKKKKKKQRKAVARKDWKIKKTATADDGGKGKKKKKAAYSREEMLAMGRQNVEAQRKKWSEVYGGLDASVAAEYDGLVVAPAKRPTFLAFHRRPSFLEKPHNFNAAATAMGKGSPQKISVH